MCNRAESQVVCQKPFLVFIYGGPATEEETDRDREIPLVFGVNLIQFSYRTLAYKEVCVGEVNLLRMQQFQRNYNLPYKNSN